MYPKEWPRINICYTFALYYKPSCEYIRRREETPTVTYRVTQQDIEAGLPESMQHCPVAHAIRRRYRSAHVRVTVFAAYIEKKRYTLPVRVSRWICSYDEGQEVRPIRFEL